METVFFIILGLCVFFGHGKPEDNRIVNLGDKTKLERAIITYNDTTDVNVALNKSVGNHGRYKNIGYDHEFLNRKPRTILDNERKKGLRWFKTDNYEFIYMESEKTNLFVKHLEELNGG